MRRRPLVELSSFQLNSATVGWPRSVPWQETVSVSVVKLRRVNVHQHDVKSSRHERKLSLFLFLFSFICLTFHFNLIIISPLMSMKF